MVWDWLRKFKDPVRYYSLKALEEAARGSYDIVGKLRESMENQVEGINAGVASAEEIYDALVKRLDREPDFLRKILRVARYARNY